MDSDHYRPIRPSCYEKAPAARRTLLGAFAKPGRPTLTIDDFDAISDELWS